MWACQWDIVVAGGLVAVNQLKLTSFHQKYYCYFTASNTYVKEYSDYPFENQENIRILKLLFANYSLFLFYSHIIG